MVQTINLWAPLNTQNQDSPARGNDTDMPHSTLRAILRSFVIPENEAIAKRPSIGFVIHFLLFSQDCLVKSSFSRLRFWGYAMHG